mmetsp:Transcript_3405/g.13568  ORF Transcript_3405/g.13568 Transcript_3405/m.13568 type:complete len:200 (+) Transcript_3405:238-837(+)
MARMGSRRCSRCAMGGDAPVLRPAAVSVAACSAACSRCLHRRLSSAISSLAACSDAERSAASWLPLWLFSRRICVSRRATSPSLASLSAVLAASFSLSAAAFTLSRSLWFSSSDLVSFDASAIFSRLVASICALRSWTDRSSAASLWAFSVISDVMRVMVDFAAPSSRLASVASALASAPASLRVWPACPSSRTSESLA